MADLSYQATRLLARIRAGHWYPWMDCRQPKAMEELKSAGLVKAVGRAAKIVRCWVAVEAVHPAPDISRELADLEALVAACEADFIGNVCLDDPDEEPVGVGTNCVTEVTFGHIRRARRALSSLRGEG